MPLVCCVVALLLHGTWAQTQDISIVPVRDSITDLDVIAKRIAEANIFTADLIPQVPN